MSKILGPDAMDLTRGPLDRPVGVKVGNKGISVPVLKRPGQQPDLHRRIGLPRSRTRRFEVDGGEAALVNKFQVASVQFSEKNPGEDARATWRRRHAPCLLLNF